MKKLFLLTLLGAPLFSYAAEKEIVDGVFQAFRSSCVSSSKWTSVAISQSQSMQDLFLALKSKNDAACKPFLDNLNAINSAEALSSLLEDPSFQNSRMAEEKLQELTVLMSGASDPNLINELKPLIVQAQIDVQMARAGSDANQSVKSRQAYNQATQRMSQLFKGLLNSSSQSSLNACFAGTPSAAYQLGINVASVAGSFISPAIGATSGAVASLLTEAIKFMGDRKYQKAMDEVAAADLPVAMMCGMESMSNFYCQANDATKLVSIAATSVNTPAGTASIWKGLDILGRKMPVLNSWIQKVRSGGDAGSSAEAERQNRAWAKIADLDSLRRTGTGLINEAKLLFNGTNDPVVQRNIVKALITSTSSSNGMGGGGPKKLLSEAKGVEAVSSAYSTYQLICAWSGIPLNVCPAPVNSGYEDPPVYFDRVSPNSFPTPDMVLINFKTSLDPVQKQVDLEFAQTISIDPEEIIVRAQQPNSDKVSPILVLKSLRDYLKSVIATPLPSNPELPKMAQSTLDIVDAVIKEIPSANQPLDKVKNIFGFLHLSDSSQYIGNRIELIVQSDLQDHLDKGDFPQDVAEIIRAAGVDIHVRMLSSGVTDLNLAQNDLNNARSVTQGNIAAYHNFFTNSMERALYHLNEQIKVSGEPMEGSNRPNRQLLGQLCGLILTTSPVWPADIPWTLCQNADYYSIHWENAQTAPEKASLMFKLSSLKAQMDSQKPAWMERVCTMQRFERNSRLHESFNNLQMQGPFFQMLKYNWQRFN